MVLQELSLVFRYSALSAEWTLQRLLGLLRAENLPTSQFEMYGKPGQLEDFKESCRREVRDTFLIEGQGMVFNQARVANHRLDFINIKAEHRHLCGRNWEEEFINHPAFIQGWLADSEYEFWQNAEDPVEYESAGRSYTHLPLKSNGLPPPLEQTVIDTSGNPGRRVLCDGYIEAIGSLMWLSEGFWELTGASREEVAGMRWLLVSNLSPSLIMVRSSSECFVSDSGESGDIQRRLRKLLFPRSLGAIRETR